MQRRDFLRRAAATTGVAALGGQFWHQQFSLAEVIAGPGPYGPLQSADANGVQVPVGFTCRIIATTGVPVAPSTYVWHAAPDGGSCFPTADGGWVYVSNSEVALGGGGVGVLRFDSSGATIDAYRILSGTHRNCAGGTDAVGHMAELRGERLRRQGVRVQPARRRAGRAAPRARLVQPRGGRRRPR